MLTRGNVPQTSERTRKHFELRVLPGCGLFNLNVCKN